MLPPAPLVQFSLRRAAVWVAAGVALLVAPAALTAPPAGAVAITPECKTVVEKINEDLAALAPADGEHLTTAEVDAARTKAATIFANAKSQNPRCDNAIDILSAQLAANARAAATIKGTAFLGPIGWAWNNVYYKVFSGNDIMMAMFGWALLLSPLILAFSVTWVMRGAQGAFHRPYVPPHLRTEQ
jgi:hypothetical protein